MPEIIVKLGERIIHRYFFDKDNLSVGRGRDNDIVIENLSVSRNHCRVKVTDGKFILTDMNSANGTFVNGVRVTKTEIYHNDQIQVGKHTLLFINTDEAGMEPASANDSIGLPTDAGIPEPPSTPPPPPSPVAAPSAVDSALVGVLTIVKGKQANQCFPIHKEETTIGRAPENDVRLHDWFVSKKHAVLRRVGEDFLLKDLESWRGTTVNGSSIKEAKLSSGDELVFGTMVVNFTVMERLEWEKIRDKHGPPPLPEVPVVPTAAEAAGAEELPSSLDGPPITEPPPPPPGPAELPSPEPPPRQQAAPDEGSLPSQVAKEDLAVLEAEADLHEGTPEEEADDRRLAWELLQAELALNAGVEEEDFTFVGDNGELDGEEAAFLRLGEIDLGAQMQERQDWMQSASGNATNDGEEEAEEWRALSVIVLPEEDGEESARRKPAPAKGAPKPTPAAAQGTTSDVDASLEQDIRMWEKALRNKSPIIRKNAARELKKLTGKDYDWNSEPAGP